MAGSLLLLLACGESPLPDGSEPTCDPRAMAVGEVRARQVGCSDELVGGGEGRVGDWLIENAVARFVVRGTYASLTELDEPGGTLIDAAEPDGTDLLVEYRPDGDRGDVEAVAGDGWAELRLTGVTYHLDADVAALEVSAATGRLVGVPGVERTGATLRGDDAFLGLDGVVVAGEGAVTLDGVTRVALTGEALWPDGALLRGEADADTVIAAVGAAAIARVPVDEGKFEAWLPAGASLVGERDGCDYDGLSRLACGTVYVRVADDLGDDLRASLTDGVAAFDVPKGGGTVPVGTTPRDLWLWAGPAYGAAALPFAGDETRAAFTLPREMSTDGVVWAAFGEEVAPDADQRRTSADVAASLAGEGVGYAVVVADDEIPEDDRDSHDPVLVRAASRAAGWLFSWPWSPNGKRPAHGAVPWHGFGALDQLALSQGGTGTGRRMAVTPAWVEAARAEADPRDWSPRPDVLWLASLDDLPVFLGLLDLWVPVTPISARAWVEVDGAVNDAGVERGLVEGRVTAGTGPRLDVSLRRGVIDGVVLVDVTLDAPAWAGIDALSLWTPAGEERRDVTGPGTETFAVPADVAWVVPVATGARARPWSDDPAWAVGGAVWIGGP
ncbi:MAG: hypothetical protein ACOZNI_28675 [Myxococcota bacterium]